MTTPPNYWFYRLGSALVRGNNLRPYFLLVVLNYCVIIRSQAQSGDAHSRRYAIHCVVVRTKTQVSPLSTLA